VDPDPDTSHKTYYDSRAGINIYSLYIAVRSLLVQPPGSASWFSLLVQPPGAASWCSLLVQPPRHFYSRTRHLVGKNPYISLCCVTKHIMIPEPDPDPHHLPVLRIRIRIHMFLDLLDPDLEPLVRGMDGSGSFFHHAKTVCKTFIPSILGLFLNFYFEK
jgi:hypothetical protein